MKFLIEIQPGNYTTEGELELLGESIRRELDNAVSVVANDVFPVFLFGAVTRVSDDTTYTQP